MSILWSTALFDTLSEASFALNSRLWVIALNRAGEALYQTPTHQVIGQPVGNLVGEGDETHLHLATWQRLTPGEVWRGLAWHKTPAGKRLRVDLSVQGMHSPSGQFEGVLVVVRDVTEREAERLRQTVLASVLHAVAEASHSDELHANVLARLHDVGGADAVITRIRQGDTYVISAIEGLEAEQLAHISAIHLTADEARSLKNGQVLHFERVAENPITRFLAALGFPYSVAVGKRSGGQLIGIITLLYRQPPAVVLDPILPQIGAALGTEINQNRQRAALEHRTQLLMLISQIDHSVLENASLPRLLEVLAAGVLGLFGLTRASVGWVPLGSDHITWLAQVGEQGAAGQARPSLLAGNSLGNSLGTGRAIGATAPSNAAGRNAAGRNAASGAGWSGAASDSAADTTAANAADTAAGRGSGAVGSGAGSGAGSEAIGSGTVAGRGSGAASGAASGAVSGPSGFPSNNADQNSPDTVRLAGRLLDAVQSGQPAAFGGAGFTIGSRFGLYVPVAMEDGVLVLALIDHLGPFDRGEERDARFLAAQFALAYRRLRDRERLERERLSLGALAQASRAFRNASDETSLLQTAVDYVLRATHADTALALIYEPGSQQLRVRAAAGTNAEACLGLVLERGGRGLSWQVFDSGEGQLIDIEHHFNEAMMLRPLRQGSYIGTPIRAGGENDERIIGVLSADTQARGDHFGQSDLDVLTAIAEALSNASSRVVALEEAEHRAKAFAQLAELSAELEILDEPQLIARRALHTLLALTGFDAATYYELYQDEAGDQRVRAVEMQGNYPPSFELERQGLRIEPGRGLFGKALESREMYIVEDYALLPDALPEFVATGLRSAVLAPISLNGHSMSLIGATSFGRIHPTPAVLPELMRFITGRLTRALERVSQTNELLATRASTFRALGLALEYRDYETKGHTDRVVQLSLQLGAAIGLTEEQLEALEWGAYLHDVGKIAVPDHILLKPGKLSPEEWQAIRAHPEIGFEMLRHLPFLPPETCQVVLYHQERFDGSGYPEALVGAEIPFLARLFAIIDVYDALTSERPYKPAWSHERAISELEGQAGRTLDARLVEHFLALWRKDAPERNSIGMFTNSNNVLKASLS
jgi:PAS domain S-box-containing protein